jgi:hypothetical protein
MPWFKDILQLGVSLVLVVLRKQFSVEVPILLAKDKIFSDSLFQFKPIGRGKNQLK